MKHILRWLGLRFCGIGWHGKLTHTGFDGASVHARCERCGYIGMIDSQGNLF